MFRRKAVRIFAGLLFGAAAGVGWGVWYEAANASRLVHGADAASGMALLTSIMLGAFSGLLIGLVVGLARNAAATMALAGLTAAISIYLSPGMPFSHATELVPSLLSGASLVMLCATAAAIALPGRRD